MTEMKPREPGIGDDGELRALWSTVLDEAAYSRWSLWMYFVDDGGRPLRRAMPIDDFPVDPDEELAERLAFLVGQLMQQDGTTAGVLLALTRPGEPGVSPRDKAWAALLRQHLAEWRGGRTVMLATVAGIVPIGEPSMTDPFSARRDGR